MTLLFLWLRIPNVSLLFDIFRHESVLTLDAY